ncbi:hypothetical protein R1sor_020192 [Riccia sorocarpa]|uniref:Uncharacterized protein n=1 Tax=Riccia sorocarpa TaxID=122646 RepID=A0ABD3IIG5_9MARC
MASSTSSLLALPTEFAAKLGLRTLQSNVIPDFLVRIGTRTLLGTRLKEIYKSTGEEQQDELMRFAQSLKALPIAVNTEDANTQHYEVPSEFFKLVLGKHLKYSSALFPKPTTTLDEAEEAMLELYCERAQLEDGQTVLDLGCGWGSLSLFVAQKYPKSQVTGVSNSDTQKAFIDGEAQKRGLTNLTIMTSDINTFEAGRTFNRVLSIEMFEHMKNYQKLLKKIASWMEPNALLFIHIFTHKLAAYHFENKDETDWMTRNFFSGGTMPADTLLLYFQDDVYIENHWKVNGKNYAQTSEEWLKKMDANIKRIRTIFAETYGEKEATKWIVNWRTFFIAVAELFGYNDGEEWGVSHYLFRKR